MLELLCKELNNYFDKKRIFENFTISNGTLDLSNELQSGQYFRIVGSVFNDGVYQYPVTDLTDETFEGAVWVLAIPKQVIALSEEIAQWTLDNSKLLDSAYQSESFGGYSYSLKQGNNGKALTWQSQFSDRLDNWRKAKCRY